MPREPMVWRVPQLEENAVESQAESVEEEAPAVPRLFSELGHGITARGLMRGVFLTGSVASDAERTQAIDLSRAAGGVANVEANLR